MVGVIMGELHNGDTPTHAWCSQGLWENLGETNFKLQEDFPEHSCLAGICMVVSEKLQKKGDPI